MNTTYHEMPQEMYPVHMFYPEFQTLGLWFPALDAWVLEMLCRKLENTLGYGPRLFLEIMEIGTFAGGSASVLAPHANNLLCVDTWAGSGKANDEMAALYAENDPLQVFLANAARFPCPVKHHKRTLNPDSLPTYLDDRLFDLIFIDGGHDYDSVAADIAIARQHIAPRGIVCGHDFTMFDGVTKAVLDFGDEVGNIEACGTVWWKEM